ncbi:hypothetical protein RhiirA1_471298 [Rhizophagus irregularis]|uniref:Crinkler effector protein N-terminal domain-containing protein n=1 Tax=Rhizophagus irregularis TaxID=588596 RepID=A0A2N0R4J8_9GLOM|nr:hypothetical protein RhiirA1_471298 [Rhizophagus irregularis]CAB4492051.1 unnamed protein product [Rhizophagus irregularis]CAB5327031.1 unnamed protein product [Rhizophagus irregularis]
MSEYVLWCFLQGDSQKFPISIRNSAESEEMISHLKYLIRKEKKSIFRYTDPSDIDLWKIELPFDEETKLQNLENHPDIDTYVEETLHGKALLSPIQTIKFIFGPSPNKNHFHVFVKKPVFICSYEFHELHHIINKIIEERKNQDTPSHTMGVGKELTELCSLGIREGDILRFKKKYTKLLGTYVKLDFKVIKIDDNSRPLVNIISPPYQSDFIQCFSGIVNSKAYKSLSYLEIDIITHVAKHQCIMDLEQDHPKTRERIGQIIKELEIQHIIEESEYLQWENKLDEIKQAILEKQMPNINSNMQFEVLRNNVNLGKVSDIIKRYLKKG